MGRFLFVYGYSILPARWCSDAGCLDGSRSLELRSGLGGVELDGGFGLGVVREGILKLGLGLPNIIRPHVPGRMTIPLFTCIVSSAFKGLVSICDPLFSPISISIMLCSVLALSPNACMCLLP